jgi:hypothetical protein
LFYVDVVWKLFERVPAKRQQGQAFVAIFLQKTDKKDFHFNPSRRFNVLYKVLILIVIYPGEGCKRKSFCEGRAKD